MDRIVARQKIKNPLKQKSINWQLISASYDGDISLVRHLLKKGADIDYRDCRIIANPNALQSAIRNTRWECAKFLIQQGANVDEIRWGYLGINIASLRTLLDAGLSVNAIDPLNGESILHFAVSERSMEFIEFAISRGVDPFIKDEEGFTALDNARSALGRGSPEWGERIVSSIEAYVESLLLAERIQDNHEVVDRLCF